MAQDPHDQVLQVCRKCHKTVGKKGGWKRDAITAQLDLIAREHGVAVVWTGCLDVCPERGVTAGLADSRKAGPRVKAVLKPKDTPAEALARFDYEVRREAGS